MNTNQGNSKKSVEELKEFFNRHYGFISLELSDEEITNFIEERWGDIPPIISQTADSLADYILANGLGEVQE